jgi:hypothetical protein
VFFIFTSVSSVSTCPSVFLFSSFCLSSLGPPSPCVLSCLCNFPFVPLSFSHSFLAFLCPVDNFPHYVSFYPFYFVSFFYVTLFSFTLFLPLSSFFNKKKNVGFSDFRKTCLCSPFQILTNLTDFHETVMISFHFKTLRTQNSSCPTISINKLAVALNFQDAAE